MHAGHRAWFCATLLALAGCDTASQDFNEWTTGLKPVSARAAANLMLDQYDADNRYRGTVMISASPFGGEDPYLAVYRHSAAHETNPLVRAASIRALGRYGAPSDALEIARRLEDESDLVRWESATALQRLHNPAVVPDLLKRLRNPDEDVDVRCAVAVALGQYPEDRVFQGLVGALDAVELSVNLAARLSLGTITGQDHGLDPRAWLAWYKSTREPFAGQRPYQYPTYQRPESLLEKLAFWSTTTFEQPGTPAGLTPPGQRSTYQVDEPAEHDAGG